MLGAQNFKYFMLSSIAPILRLLPAIIIIFSISPAQAKPIVADLAIRQVDIDHNFAGLDILMFGARNDTGRIVVVLRGPEKNYIVRRKEKVGGIWINRNSVPFNNVSSFYAISATHGLEDIKNDTLLDMLGVGVENIRLDTEFKHRTAPDIGDYRKAFIRNRQNEGLYTAAIAPVTFWETTLFRTVLKFPKNIGRGKYTAEVYLFNGGQLTSMQSTPVNVSKVGFEAFISDFAHEHAVMYGLLCVAMALLAGWGANVIFGRI